LRHLVRRTAQAAGIAAVAVTLATTPAFAGDGSVSSTTGAQAWFIAYGDHVWVKDTDADGHSALAQVQFPNEGISENLWNSDGAGTSREKGYATVVAEGSPVWYRACVGESGTGEIIRCGVWVSTTTTN